LGGKARLSASTNNYDWLGEGLEGKPAFPGSKIALKSHIQIAVKDPACIAEVFAPEVSQYRSATIDR
ncbi:MAG TPA: hypothetical protein VFC44_04735, partial [Candidatus Saccharimonadales bacterium]|nr:hypothetical protein [Candidatus Saccharimonadales bacterium]